MSSEQMGDGVGASCGPGSAVVPSRDATPSGTSDPSRGTRILFLDIDGVLNIMSRDRDEFGSLFHPHLVENLRRVIDGTGADIVISSTWRMDGIDRMQKMWAHRHLPGRVVGVTPDCAQAAVFGSLQYFDAVERGHEIKAWLAEHDDVIAYAIVDDDNDMLEEQRPFFVRTSNNEHHPDNVQGYGLTRECADYLIRILRDRDASGTNEVSGPKDGSEADPRAARADEGGIAQNPT